MTFLLSLTVLSFSVLVDAVFFPDLLAKIYTCSMRVLTLSLVELPQKMFGLYPVVRFIQDRRVSVAKSIAFNERHQGSIGTVCFTRARCYLRRL